MTHRAMQPGRLIQWGIIGLALVISALIFVSFFERVPIEGTTFLIDFRAFWKSIENGNLVYYEAHGLRVPPWSVLFILPLGFVSLRTAWGLLVFASFVILVGSVPRIRPMGKYLASVLLLVVSFLTLRVMVDGNFEGLMVGGVVLMLAGFRKRNAFLLAIGMLLATFKPQAVFLLIFAVGVYLLVERDWRFIIKTTLITLAVMIPAMLWRGSDWLVALGGENFNAYTGNFLDISLAAAFNRSGLFAPIVGIVAQLPILLVTLALAWKTRTGLSREKAGMLMAASLLLAPYAAGNTTLTVLAIGVIPLFQKRPVPGLILILLTDAAFLINRAEFAPIVSYFWTAFVVLTWAMLAWHVYRAEWGIERNDKSITQRDRETAKRRES
jgi:hypothetical protein